MKSEITISELASLMNVSTHQIRYFEKKGVLEPAYTDNNQYRMYGIEQVYQLANILLLRKLGIPVHSIKVCMTSFSTDQYRQLIQQSLKEIETELMRLEQLQQFIKNILREQQNLSLQSQQYQIKHQDISYFTCWIEMESGTKLDAKQLTKQAKCVSNLFETDIHYIYDGSSTIRLYTKTEAPSDFSLPEGNYLTMQCLINDENDLEHLIEQFYDHVSSQSYVTSGPIILIEKSYLSLFNNNKLHYELQALIEKVATSEGGKAHDYDINNY
ncbi:MerR family transcriptional regulator [Bacillus toyonensis]|uniref:Transcriptional regulator n=1 Tax=Bacillus toyonensis TaxID=155322 RepID=A0A2C4PZY0_9BACI|nr:MerR family transcriptional regulator [Bacillus toyonensis]PHD57831.1 transcriptional regulator [Bacillus toyonensis]